jgi:hypothetical protein
MHYTVAAIVRSALQLYPDKSQHAIYGHQSFAGKGCVWYLIQPAGMIGQYYFH